MTPTVAFVLWDGLLFGGAETATIALAAELRAQQVDARIVFVGEAGVYEPSLLRSGVPFASAGFPTGAAVLLRPGRLARVLSDAHPGVVVLPSAGFLARAVRLGGITVPVVAVEHGGLLQTPMRSFHQRIRDRMDRFMGRGCVDAQVAVSDYLLETLQRVSHAPHVVRIHNGVDVTVGEVARAARAERRQADPTVVVGAAGKFMRGKGFEDLIEASGRIRVDTPWRVELAGDGPLRRELEERARVAGVEQGVVFHGWVEDMTSFWAGSDIAVAASNGCVESFGMVAAEAFASGIPALVSRSGGLPEVLGTAGAGESFRPGDVDHLAVLMRRFIEDAALRERSGDAALLRARELSVSRAAREYLSLFRGLIDSEVTA
jgi:glycosyltransferase involved in cell wall biosynthesis